MARRDATAGADDLEYLLSDVPTKRGRSREWERKYPTVSFRHWPPSIKKRINKIARDLQVPAYEIARALMECGLEAYDAGELEMRPTVASHSLTLYSSENGAGP